MPSVKDYIKNTKSLPKCLTTSFALYIAFYKNGKEMTESGLAAVRPNGDSYTISDDKAVLEFYLAHKDDSVRNLAYAVCANEDFWGEDLTKLEGFAEMVADTLERIEKSQTSSINFACIAVCLSIVGSFEALNELFFHIHFGILHSKKHLKNNTNSGFSEFVFLLCGGDYKARTCDLYDVNVAL